MRSAIEFRLRQLAGQQVPAGCSAETLEGSQFVRLLFSSCHGQLRGRALRSRPQLVGSALRPQL